MRGMKALRAWLESSNTTQQSLAERMGVKPPTVSQWLSGQYTPRPKKLRELSAITGLSIEQLLAEPAAAAPSTPSQAAA